MLFIGGAANTNVILFSFTRPIFESTINRTHYTTDAVQEKISHIIILRTIQVIINLLIIQNIEDRPDNSVLLIMYKIQSMLKYKSIILRHKRCYRSSIDYTFYILHISDYRYIFMRTHTLYNDRRIIRSELWTNEKFDWGRFALG